MERFEMEMIGATAVIVADAEGSTVAADHELETMLLGCARVSMRCSKRTAMRGRSQDGVPPLHSPTSLAWGPRGFTMFRGFRDRNASEVMAERSIAVASAICICSYEFMVRSGVEAAIHV